ncbi:hypothetical protein THRCLA_05970 [Thraustotheca clavata]|uniref:Uncharacterized protein n=1 Tax=Thraustotheca clavata TaxID=74557 RepID=A0A1V9ZQR7_9STRA|nr:hypothetical protein THRCLA_05970 [Thraustotheca clavata]
MNDRWKPAIPVHIFNRGSFARSPLRLHRVHRENFKENNQKYHAIAEIRQVAAQEIQAQIEKRKLVVQYDVEMRNMSTLKGLETRNGEFQVRNEEIVEFEKTMSNCDTQRNEKENNESELKEESSDALSVKQDDDVSKICDDTLDNNHEDTVCDDTGDYGNDHEQINRDFHVEQWIPTYQPIAKSTASDSTEGLFDSEAEDLDSEALYACDDSMALHSQDLDQVSLMSQGQLVDSSGFGYSEDSYLSNFSGERQPRASESIESDELFAAENDVLYENIPGDTNLLLDQGCSSGNDTFSPEIAQESDSFGNESLSMEENISKQSNDSTPNFADVSTNDSCGDAEFDVDCSLYEDSINLATNGAYNDTNTCFTSSMHNEGLDLAEPEKVAETDSFGSYHSSEDSKSEINPPEFESHGNETSDNQIYFDQDAKSDVLVDLSEENLHDEATQPHVVYQNQNGPDETNWMKVFLRLIPSIILLTFGIAGLHTRNNIYALQYQVVAPRIERLSLDLSNMHQYLDTLATTMDKLKQSVSKHGAMDLHFESAYRAYYLSIENRRRTVEGYKDMIYRMQIQTYQSMQGIQESTIESVSFLTKHYQLPISPSQNDVKSLKVLWREDNEALRQLSLHQKALELYLAEMPSIQFGFREWFTMWSQCPRNMLPFSLPQHPIVTAESDTETHILLGLIALFLALPIITCSYGCCRHLSKSYLNNQPRRLSKKDYNEAEILSPVHFLPTRSDEDTTTTA